MINVFDLGYLGIEKDFPDQKSSIPNRKKEAKKSWLKRKKSATRITLIKGSVMEHTICRMKKYRIASDVFRNRLRNYDKISDIVSGLVNFRALSSF